MGTKSFRKRLIVGVVTASVVTATLTVNVPVAHAEPVAPTGKGIVGGAFLGAELVMIPMALFQVKSGWAYAIGGGLGAIGGGVGGWAIEQAIISAGGDGTGPEYMLAGGMALVIPTIVLMLNATRYRPAEDAQEDKSPQLAPPADPGQKGGAVVIGGSSGGTTTPPANPPPPNPPPSGGGGGGGGGTPPAPYVPMDSLLHFNKGFTMGVPIPEVHSMYTMRESKELGVPRQYELRIPIVKVTF